MPVLAAAPAEMPARSSFRRQSNVLKDRWRARADASSQSFPPSTTASKCMPPARSAAHRCSASQKTAGNRVCSRHPPLFPPPEYGCLLPHLLRRDYAYDRNAKFLIAVRLVHEENPKSEQADRDHQADGPQQQSSPGRDRHERIDKNPPRDPEHNPECAVQNGLHRMESHEAVVLIRLQHEKQNPGDETENVGQRAGHIWG